MNAYDEVLFEEFLGHAGNLGIITLNRPKALNSLTFDMVKAMHAQLRTWSSAPHIKAVVIRAVEGPAFCAGGDLRMLYKRYLNHEQPLSQFFIEEYQLNQFIFHFKKPYIALLDGITMGGGVGVSVHGSHRVATERLVFAMPETGIGFFPDVGGTFFLPRLPHDLGIYLGLTGTRITSDDCVALSIAQQKVSSEALPQLITALAEHPFDHDPQGAVSYVIEQFKVPTHSSLLAQGKEFSTYFSKPTVEEILSSLKQSSNPLCLQAAEYIASKSPTSLKVTLKAFREGKQIEFDTCMRQEFRMTCHFLQENDFFEGIRAVIIDKDQKPHWKPSTLAEVSDHTVENYFAPLAQELI